MKVVLLIIATFLVLSTIAQEPTAAIPHRVSVKGRIIDSLTKKGSVFASIALLQQDSTLSRFARSRRDGNFLIENVATGKYVLLVTHPYYADLSQELIVKNDLNIDLGDLSLGPKADLLSAVTVTPRIALPRMNGDTLEYNTANIVMRANANIEDLLRRLPGVQVDANGVITVNGQRIDRLTVEGEDLFGKDPTIVTRNLNADMIAKAQIVDRKSDKAQFTGIDDGQRTMTLNLVLKTESKSGYFGKVEAGGDMSRYYNASGLIGAFKSRRQFASLGGVSNTGSTSFSAAVDAMGAGINIGSSDDGLGGSAGTGIPTTAAGGVHYADKWNGDQHHIVGNYQYSHLSTSPYSSSIIRQTLPDSIYVQRLSSQSINTLRQQGADLAFDGNPDTVTAYRLSFGGSDSRGRNSFASSSKSSINDITVNEGIRTVNSDVSNRNFRGSGMWRIVGRKRKTRNFSVNTGISKSDNSSMGFLNSTNHYFHSGDSLFRSDTVDQRKVIGNSTTSIVGGVTYTEPINDKTILGVNASASFTKSNLHQYTYDRGDGKYRILIDSLSTHYQTEINSRDIEFSIQSVDKRLSYTVALDLMQRNYKQVDLFVDSAVRYKYFDLIPHSFIRYATQKNKAISLDYMRTTIQPSVDQLQPTRNNNDPLHVILGNPELRPGFLHHFGLGFSSIGALMVGGGFNFDLSTNAITDKTSTDSSGRQVSQPVNVEGAKDMGFNFSVNRRLAKSGIDLGFNSSVRYRRSVNYVNDYLSHNDNYDWNGSLSVSKYAADKFSVQINASGNYTYSRSSINPAAAVQFWTESVNGRLSVSLPAGFEINSDIAYMHRQKFDEFDKNNTIIIWNGYLGKNLLKNRLEISWRINDILNRNAGVSRTVTANQTSENYYNVLGRYWTLKATYRFIHRK